MSRRRSRRRATLFWQQNGLCHWCDEPMRLFERVPHPNPPDAAVLYHLDDRYSEDRGTFGANVERTVLCCRKCANEISTEMQDWVPVEERQMRAGRFPKSSELEQA